MTDTSSPAQWGDLYRETQHLYQSLCTRVQSLLRELLAAEEISAVQVDARAKDVHSLVEKIGRRPGRYPDPLNDITDLAGVRVIVYYASDVERVDTLIEREFHVDTENSWRRTPTTDPDRFGYRSDHYVVSCSPSRAALREWEPYRGLKAEIQVRTVLQHAWAAIDHRLNYKRASEIPAELKRQLFRISALLEVADDQFEAVRLGAERLNSSYQQRVSSGELELPIDRASVEVYVNRSPRAQWWTAAAARAGFTMETAPWRLDTEAEGTDAVGDLTQASQLAGFTTLSQLDRFLEEAEVWGYAALTAMRDASSTDTWYGSSAFILTSVILMGSNLSREDLSTAFGAEGDYVDNLIRGRAAISPR